MNRYRIAKMNPVQLLVMGYVLIIGIGSLLLRLPVSSSAGVSQPYIDSLFTATSAVSTTGLIVVDTGAFYSLFGQSIILVLFQIGGLGYMVFVVLMVYILGKKPSLVSAVTLKESMSGVTIGNMKQFLKAVIIFTLLFEGCGAAFLTVYWMQHFSVSESIFLGIFHSVSAFCTSGFSTFSDSFTAYQTDVVINLVISALSIAGGVGFIVLSDARSWVVKWVNKVRPCQLSLHSKLSLLISAGLMTAGVVILFGSEPEAPLGRRLIISFFQSVSASSTTGFNTVDIGNLTSTSLFALIVLMFIGASPGGSGGGIKVTAFGAMVSSVWALLKGRAHVDVFNRHIPPTIIQRSFALVFLVIVWVILVTMVLTVTEKSTFLPLLFEVVSAAGTVGLSTGITSSLTTVGKLLLIVTMLIGRIGPLTIAFSVIGEPKQLPFKHPEGEIYIG